MVRRQTTLEGELDHLKNKMKSTELDLELKMDLLKS